MGRVVVGLVLVAAAGCARDIGEPASSQSDPAAYVAALDEFLPAADSDDPPVVFLVSLGEPISLDNQVAIIDEIGEDRDVEFVDDPEVVIDDDSADRAPADAGMLIGIGTIPTEPPYTVRVEVYRNGNAVEGHLVTLAPRGGQWVVESTEAVAPEVLAHEQ